MQLGQYQKESKTNQPNLIKLSLSKSVKCSLYLIFTDCFRDLDCALVSERAIFESNSLLITLKMSNSFMGGLVITLNWLKPKTKPYYAWSSKACIDGIWGNKFGF